MYTDMATCIYVADESITRPEADEVYIIKTPNIAIPWPVGYTVEEALLKWRDSCVSS